MRQSGFYKVKHNGEWVVAHWSADDECWYLTGTEYPFYDVDFDKIQAAPVNMPG